MASTALLALRMASESGFQVSSNLARRALHSKLQLIRVLAYRGGGLELFRKKPGYTNRATKRAMLATAASKSFMPLPPWEAG